jgi:hypothetical protein
MSGLPKSQLSALLDAIAKGNPEWALQQAYRFGRLPANTGAVQRTIKRAAEMLDLEAETLKEYHAPDGDWTDEAVAKQEFDDFKKMAKALREVIAGAKP